MLGLVAQYTTTNGGSASGFAIVYLLIYATVVAGMWAIFVKAGEQGWKAIIPIYNWIILLKIVGRPWWWILLFLIPVVDIVIIILMYNDLSKSFGKGVGFTVGLIFLSPIFIPILGFGSDRYLGPGGASAAAAAAAAGSAIPPPPPPMPTA